MALLYDRSSMPINSGYWEWGGSGDGSPPLADRVSEAASYGTVTPPGGCTVIQQIKCAPGDIYQGSTGYRTLTRKTNPIDEYTAPRESWYVWAFLLPDSYPGDANMYLTGMEIHQTSPGGTTGVAPMGFTHYGSSMRVRVWGGATNASGGIGNPGHSVTYDHTWTTGDLPHVADKNVWHVVAMRYKLGGANGAFEFWHGVEGVDLDVVSLTGTLTGVATCYGTLGNYEEFGIYRNQTGSSTTTIYTAGWREYDDQSEALTWASTMLGGTGSGVPPDPDPDVEAGLLFYDHFDTEISGEWNPTDDATDFYEDTDPAKIFWTDEWTCGSPGGSVKVRSDNTGSQSYFHWVYDQLEFGVPYYAACNVKIDVFTWQTMWDTDVYESWWTIVAPLAYSSHSTNQNGLSGNGPWPSVVISPTSAASGIIVASYYIEDAATMLANGIEIAEEDSFALECMGTWLEPVEIVDMAGVANGLNSEFSSEVWINGTSQGTSSGTYMYDYEQDGVARVGLMLGAMTASIPSPTATVYIDDIKFSTSRINQAPCAPLAVPVTVPGPPVIGGHGAA